MQKHMTRYLPNGRTRRRRSLLYHPLAALLLLTTLLAAGCSAPGSDVFTIRRGDTTYRGQLRHGLRDGLGVLTRGDTVVYSGSWRGGMRQGRGWTTDTSGAASTACGTTTPS